jgi:hypothetical protein
MRSPGGLGLIAIIVSFQSLHYEANLQSESASLNQLRVVSRRKNREGRHSWCHDELV